MANWQARRIISYAHQGGSFEAPSSTLFAVRNALEVGATGIELDIHATSDGCLVACHDPDVDRTTNGSGKIASMSFDELSHLDNAYWFAPGTDVALDLPVQSYPYRNMAEHDPAFRIARLEEIMELMQDFPGVVLNLDIKQTRPDVVPYENLLADLIRRYSFGERTIVASFFDSALRVFHQYAPEIPTSAGPGFVAEFVRAIRAGTEPDLDDDLNRVSFQVPVEFQGITVVDANFVKMAHRYGLAVHVWTINDTEEMERLVDLSVDGIITDRPSVLVSLLAEKGVAWRPG
ncbi:MAG: glycerophosphodiester phosphodiesterase [Actinobacteria bacterium]|jgi:glycerophosphoryl diester phosphodiesterase|nr:glycerophosphodiester phosphodiesterase [Actinomycetota bacterium]